tara:strand:- start:7028 stop:7711 length:684 start_codon:yes stop_codon:yes gene_type:complete
MFLGGRHAERLAGVAKACRKKGAVVHETIHDVVDAEAMTNWVHRCDGIHPLDLVVANAGISAGTGFAGESAEQVRRIFSVNVDGALNTVLPAVPAMVERGRGQLAVVSSLASFRGFPGTPAHCVSKAALRVWGEGQWGWLVQNGAGLSVICPGFVKTPMSDGNPYGMPFLMDAERSAQIIKRGLAKNRGRIAYPWQTYWMAQAVVMMPVALTDQMLRRLPNKPSDNG